MQFYFHRGFRARSSEKQTAVPLYTVPEPRTGPALDHTPITCVTGPARHNPVVQTHAIIKDTLVPRTKRNPSYIYILCTRPERSHVTVARCALAYTFASARGPAPPWSQQPQPRARPRPAARGNGLSGGTRWHPRRLSSQVLHG